MNRQDAPETAHAASTPETSTQEAEQVLLASLRDSRRALSAAIEATDRARSPSLQAGLQQTLSETLRLLESVEQALGAGAASATGIVPDGLADTLAARDAEIRGLMAKLGRERAQVTRLGAQCARVQQEFATARAEIALLRASFAFQIGSALVAAVRSPRGALALPLRLARLLRQALPRGLRRLRRALLPKQQDDAPDLGPEFVLPGTPEPPLHDPPLARLQAGTAGATRLPEVQAELRLATIMDEFSFNAFHSCCRMLALTADDWQAQMEEFAPHMLLVESAWKGQGESWARKVYPLSAELVQVVAWCRARGIPTIFWNKEDPVHLSVFMRTARQFDFVFTTDVDCVRAYKAALGHDQVYWLPFACQPAEHNPVEEHERKDAFCFAGSYYAKYPERQHDFQTLVEVATSLRPCDIYDRNAGKGDAALEYPARFQPMIRGALPYDQISLAYKGYRFGINLNTVKQSQSMFARRVFELLACNTVTVSNFSRGLRLLFGDLVVSSDDRGELLARLVPLVEDDARYRRFRLAGLRKVLSEHTYQDRLRYLLEKVGGAPRTADLPHVAVVAFVADEAATGRVLAAFARQAYPNRSLWLVAPREVLAGLPVPDGQLHFLDPSQAASLDASATQAGWLAGFCAADHYGEHYLTDLVLATRYCAHRVIGKQARHRAESGVARPVDLGHAYMSASEALPLRRALVAAGQVSGRSIGWLGSEGLDTGLPGAMAIDEFNYCESGAHLDCSRVDDLPRLSTGMELGRLQALAEATAVTADRAKARVPDIDASTLAGWLSAVPDGLTLKLDGDRLVLGSTLQGNKHVYVYARQAVPVDTLFPGRLGRFHFAVDTEMLLSFVLIFLDEDRKRIGHAIRACGSNISMIPPAGTCFVRFGLRIQGPGRASIRGMVLDHLPSPVVGIPGRGRHLLVSRGYPSYDNLYSYAYVHRRVQGYRREGLAVDVFRLADGNLGFAEFEGVDVVAGGLSDLETALRSNDYESVLVHALDRGLWSVLQAHERTLRVVAWIHGAEIQPWYRRDFSFLDARDRERGIQRSDDRMAFWRNLLSDWPDNLHLVFVSRHLVREVERDLGIELDPARYEVIHNHIDEALFEYRPKPPSQRTRILSIRPYSRPTYANDLSVKAILDLSHEPYFDELEFLLVGDGRLFEQTLEPLRGFSNVIIEQRFLTQAEIADLHKRYGVFLCPSRIDSQGVSRDEAMSSGLVPITNRVSAIPEFVDTESAFLAEAEDWRGMADAIRRLYAEPETFLRMSAAAAYRVRRQSGQMRTLAREIALVENRLQVPAGADVTSPARKRLAVYGDLDLNLIDGSSVWAASLADTLSRLEGMDIDLFLKTPIRNTEVIRGLLGKVNVGLFEPPAGTSRLTPAQALDWIERHDGRRKYHAAILRGFDLAVEAVDRPALAGRLWIYLTDIPNREDDFMPETRSALEAIADGASLLLCQTPRLANHLEALAPAAVGKTRQLPPMIPGKMPARRRSRRSGEPLRLAYAGKFAPLWGIRELFATVAVLRSEGLPIELHVFGDKIHNPPDDPSFRDEVTRILESGEGVTWHRGLDRMTVLARLQDMDAGWAWRQQELEGNTLELSTKVLEYVASGVPPILARGAVNVELLGDGYPLFADTTTLRGIVRALVEDAELARQARSACMGLVGDYTFETIGERYLAPLLSGLGLHHFRVADPGQDKES
jgi:glycosyltransferase involved in cell wall biosynthesis/spore maturation protein CgeB